MNGVRYTFSQEGLPEGQTEATGQSEDTPPDDPLFKVCRICEQTKPVTDFYETEGKLKRARCKECMKQNVRTNGTGKKKGKGKKGARASSKERHGTLASTTPEKLLAALSGAGSDTTLQAINGIVETQKLIVELLRERR